MTHECATSMHLAKDQMLLKEDIELVPVTPSAVSTQGFGTNWVKASSHARLIFASPTWLPHIQTELVTYVCCSFCCRHTRPWHHLRESKQPCKINFVLPTWPLRLSLFQSFGHLKIKIEFVSLIRPPQIEFIPLT
jgi:hypothetical protein